MVPIRDVGPLLLRGTTFYAWAVKVSAWKPAKKAIGVVIGGNRTDKHEIGDALIRVGWLWFKSPPAMEVETMVAWTIKRR